MDKPSPLPLPIATTRLTIRAPTQSDVPDWVALNCSEVERRWLGGPLKRSTGAVAEGIARKRGQINEQLTIVEQDSGAFVGQCGFLVRFSRPGEVELYCVLKSGQHRKGYGPEVCAAMIEAAFKTLGMQRVIAIIDPGNAASIKMAERLGFEYAGPWDDPGERQHGYRHYVIDFHQSEAPRRY